MRMTPRLRQFALTAHVVASVGWLGAVVGSLALAITGLASRDAQVVRAAYLMLEMTGWYVLIPLGIASLVTGLVISLGTPWGLVRHYWVVMKLVITVMALLILVMYMGTLGELAGRAADMTVSVADVRIWSPVLHAAGALLALLVTTTLSVYKPRGLTRYGWRKQRESRAPSRP